MLVEFEDRAYCQPCLSPVWDTGLAGHAMLEAGRIPVASLPLVAEEANSRRCRRLDGAAAGTAAGRLGVSI